MERLQLVGLAFHEARSVDVRYRIQFQGGAEKKVGPCFDIDLLTGSEGSRSTKGAATKCGVTECKVEGAGHVLGMTYLHSSW